MITDRCQVKATGDRDRLFKVPHFQPIGLHEIERTQHAIESREDAQVFLGKVEITLRVLVEAEAGVDISLECHERGAGVVFIEGAMPLVVSLIVLIGQFFADVHQRLQLGATLFAEHADQFL